MNELIDNRGGNRHNSGRKKIPDKKVQVYATVRQSMIDLLGEDKVKELMVQAVKWNGQLDDMKIALDADMKIVRYSYQDGPVELEQLQWLSNKLMFTAKGKNWFISQFQSV